MSGSQKFSWKGILADKARYSYIIIGILIFICLGTVYSWSVFRKPVEDLYKIGATESGLPYMFFLAFYAFSMPFAGKAIEKKDPRIITIIGGLLVGLGWFLSGLVNNIYLLVISYGIIAGVGVGIVYGVPIAVVARWFPDRKGLAVGLTLVGFGLSPFVTAPLSNYLIELYGPLTTFMIMGILFTFVITILGLFLRFPEADELSNMGEKKGKTKVMDTNILKDKTFYGLWFSFIIGTLIGLMIIGITGPVASEIIKLNSKSSAILISVFAVFNGLGRPLFGWITDNMQIKYTAILSYLMFILGAILMLNIGAGNVFFFTLAFALFWLNFGGWLAIAPAATANFFGLKSLSKNYGIVFTAYGVGAIIGTLLSGRLRDLSGSYIFIFYPIIALSIVGIVIALIFLKEREVG